MKHYADIFDEQFRRFHRLPLTGLPSRSSYARWPSRRDHGLRERPFVRTGRLFDSHDHRRLVAGRTLGDLEQFTTWRDGKRFQAVDFNFWGVTFAEDGNRFYATLASGGPRYLVEGNVDARETRVVRTGVECPSLSPDNTRIAYKHMISRAGMWQLRIYDLRTGSND